MCRSRFTCTRQPDRYDVQPESQALLRCRRMYGSSRFATSPPYQRAPPIGQHPPTPRQSQPGLDWPSGVPGNARGADAHFWAGPPVGRRQGRAGHPMGRFPEPPATPPSIIAISPNLKCCHSNTTPSSRLPPAGRSGRCKYRLWAAHAVAH